MFSIVLLGSCEKEGCTDPLSNNYDPKANTDNGFCVPTVITNEITEIHSTFIFTGGNVTNEGGSSVTARGICWSINPSPTISDNAYAVNDGIGEFIQSICCNGFSPNTNYYVRAYATNSNGTGYGEEITFTSFKEVQYGNGVTDVNGNNYSTVIIGDQEWMSENLRVSKFNNGSSITQHLSGSTPNSSWLQSTTPGYINTDGNTYYNSYVINSNEDVCPIGWHLPSNQDFTNLKNFVEESGFTGNLVGRALSSEGWKYYSPGDGSSGIRSNDFGFNAHGHGVFRGYLGSNNNLYLGYFESVTYAGNNSGLGISYSGSTGIGTSGSSGTDGLSIRCLKD